MKNLDYDKEFLNEWINRGDEDSDYLMKFFCYFVAFNYLYSTYTFSVKEKAYNERRFVERNMIESFLWYVFKKNEDFKSYNPYDNLEDSAELFKGVKSEVKRETEYEIERRLDKLSKEDPFELFQCIYTVRCNLFHGSKSMDVLRNSKLIKESNLVLRDFLKRFIL